MFAITLVLNDLIFSITSLNDHLRNELPSDVIRIRGGPSDTSFIGSIE